MKLVDAIKQVAQGHPSAGLDPEDLDDKQLILAAHRFLFGNADSITPETQKLLNTLKLDESDFDFIGRGAHATAYGNKDVVLRLGGDGESKNNIAVENIPRGLAADVIHSGECNGIKYRLAERLDKTRSVTIEQTIPFLFKVRAKEVVYHDPTSDNFGYDRAGNLKVADHGHFQKLEQPPGNFYASLNEAINAVYPDIQFPVITSDDQNTYVIFEPDVEPSKHNARKNSLLAKLSAIGIDSHSIETMDDPPIIRIGKTQISYGTPPQTDELANFIRTSDQIHLEPRNTSVSKVPRII